MYCRRLAMLILAMILGLSFIESSSAQNVDERAQKAANTLEQRAEADTKAQIPEGLLSKAKCIVVVPNYLEFAIGIGGGGGKGLASCRHTETGEWGAPAFYDMGKGSIGISLGGGSGDVVTLVMDDDGVDALTSGAVTLGQAGATAMAGEATGTAGAETMKASFITYAQAKAGLMAGVDLGGISINFNKKANTKAYKKELSAFDTLMVEKETPPGLMVFNEALNKYAPKP